MNFTDRFIKVPCKEFDIAHKNLTGNEILRDTFEMVNPFEIASYRPSYSLEEPDIERVNITYKSGDTTLVYMSFREFEKLLNTFK